MINWLRGKFCKLPEHNAKLRYEGMFVFGYKCKSCGHEWYEPRHKNKPLEGNNHD